MTFTAVVTSHNNLHALHNILDMLEHQTQKPNEVIVLVSGYDKKHIKDSWIICEDLQDAGHDKRSQGLTLSNSEFTGFFNDDDFYHPQYIEKMVNYAPNHDLIYCDFISHLYGNQLVTSSPQIQRITSGNFIVRTDVAKKVGYNHRHYQADGQFIVDLLNKHATSIRLPEVLYVHL